MKPFWAIRNQGEGTGEVRIYGEIAAADGLFVSEDATTPRQFAAELDDLGEIDTLNVRINSPGGNVFAGNAIHNILRRNPARKVVTVDGLAASAASVVAMAGDEVVMPTNSLMMIHEAHGAVMGNAGDIREFADVLDTATESVVSSYVGKTGLSARRIREMVAEETWLTAAEAMEHGFADRVDRRQVSASMRGDLLQVNGLEVDLSQYEKRPKLNRQSGRGNEQAAIAAAYSKFEEMTNG